MTIQSYSDTTFRDFLNGYAVVCGPRDIPHIGNTQPTKIFIYWAVSELWNRIGNKLIHAQIEQVGIDEKKISNSAKEIIYTSLLSTCKRLKSVLIMGGSYLVFKSTSPRNWRLFDNLRTLRLCDFQLNDRKQIRLGKLISSSSITNLSLEQTTLERQFFIGLRTVKKLWLRVSIHDNLIPPLMNSVDVAKAHNFTIIFATRMIYTTALKMLATGCCRSKSGAFDLEQQCSETLIMDALRNLRKLA